MAKRFVLDDLKNRIFCADIVSFDIFDTILLRNVIEPTDIFKVVEFEYNQMGESHIDFYKIRIDSEEIARRKTHEEDVTLDEIYKYIELKIGSREVAEKLKKLEIEMERKFLVPNLEIKEVYNRAIELNKTVYIISDMYLPIGLIKEFLDISGFTQYDGLFVSSELKLTKASGSIYKYIQSISKRNLKWLHIGDNYTSDVLRANENNVQGYYYPKLSERESLEGIRNLSDSIIRAIQINHKYSATSQNYWYRFGADYVSSIYIGLMNWLIKELEGKDNIFFLSRDGNMPYKLYQLMKNNNPNLPEGRYMYASRRAYIYPQLLFMDREKALDILTCYNAGLDQKTTIKEILGNLGLSCKQYIHTMKLQEINNCNEIVSERNIISIKNFLNSIWDDIETVLEKELIYLEQYLESIGIQNFETINIFDIGWSGSTQMAIQKITKKKVCGYYLGTHENVYNDIKDAVKGYLFNKGFPDEYRKFVIENVMMFELLFTAPEGSLINFSYVDGDITPNLSNVENNETMYEYISGMHQGVHDIFKISLKYQSYINQSSVLFVLSGMRKYITSYSVSDMVKMLDLSNSIGFGRSKDIKRYSNLIELNEYLSNKDYHDFQSNFLLWKNALIIRDEQGRYFNRAEIHKLYKDRRYRINSLQLRWYVQRFIKAIKNPTKIKNYLIKHMKRKAANFKSNRN